VNGSMDVRQPADPTNSKVSRRSVPTRRSPRFSFHSSDTSSTSNEGTDENTRPHATIRKRSNRATGKSPVNVTPHSSGRLKKK